MANIFAHIVKNLFICFDTFLMIHLYFSWKERNRYRLTGNGFTFCPLPVMREIGWEHSPFLLAYAAQRSDLVIRQRTIPYGDGRYAERTGRTGYHESHRNSRI
jgi:hypothetical protein